MKKVHGSWFIVHSRHKSNELINQLTNNQSGQMFIIVLIVLSIVLINTVLLLNGSISFLQNTTYSVDNIQASNLAEAGIDKAVAALNSSAGSYNGENNTIFGGGTYNVVISQIDSSTSLIKATGYVPNNIHPIAIKTIQVQVSKGSGVSFSYGVQVGQGGLILTGGSTINGSVYSNGNIDLSGGGVINGSAYAAGGTSSTADQDGNTCSGSSCQDYDFGLDTGGERRYDVAQGFKPSTPNGTVINKIRLMLKKKGTIGNGSHPDITVKLVADNGGKPSKTVLASGTISSNLVTGTYGWVDVGLSPAAALNQNTQYWIVVITCGEEDCQGATSSWSWQRDSLGGYPASKGKPGFSPQWDASGTPSWTQNIIGNLSFQTFMGGIVTHIAGTGSSNINGSAYANTMTGDNSSALKISQDAYYQIQNGITVQNRSCSSNTHCHANQTDPVPIPLPISDSNINDWKLLAQAQGIHTGNVNINWPCSTVLQGYYTGSVTLGGGCVVIMKTPLYIAGGLTIGNGDTLKLDSIYGAASGVIVVDGQVVLSGGSKVLGSGDVSGKSLMLVLSTYPSPGGAPAIKADGGNSSSILYASQGSILIEGGAKLYEVVAQQLTVQNGGIVNYQSGIPLIQFPSGPSGSYTVIKGSYQTK